jgi:hypothetical protein
MVVAREEVKVRKGGRVARRSVEEWHALVEASRASELPRAVFCREHGISTTSLYRWEQRLSKAEKPGFIELHANTEFRSAGRWSVELSLPNGTVLRIEG